MKTIANSEPLDVITGHVVWGKCATTSHLIYQCGAISKETIKNLKRMRPKRKKVSSGMPVLWTNLNVSISVVSHAHLTVEI